MSRLSTLTSRAAEDRGSALIWALLFVVVTSGMVISHAVFLASSRREHDVRYSQEAMATTFARSGLVDTLGWFRQQEQQPVASFDPVFDPNGDPPRFDTIDPTLGLVREFEIRGNLWGRYEIRRDDVVDISASRGQAQPGSVWGVSARSYVYRIYDDTVPFDQAPNRVVATNRMTSEMRGIPLALPTPAAVVVDDPDDVYIRRRAIIDGSSRTGVAYFGVPPDELLPPPDLNLVDALASVLGSPDKSALPVLNSDPEDVFSMRLDELRDLSDMVLHEDDSETGSPLYPGLARSIKRRVVFIEGDVDVPDGLDMQGVLLVVDGDLTLLDASNSSVLGVVYVSGDATFLGDVTMRGSLVVRGVLDVGGGSGTSQITYDQQIIDDIRSRVGHYRMRRTVQPGR